MNLSSGFSCEKFACFFPLKKNQQCKIRLALHTTDSRFSTIKTQCLSLKCIFSGIFLVSQIDILKIRSKN